MKAVFLISYFALISAIGEKRPFLQLLSKRPTIPRIVGGHILQKNEFPWMVSLQYEGQHFCGGTIISKEWALTAAHCVDPNSAPKQFEVVCGAYSLSQREPNEQRVSPKTIIIHEKWNTSIISDDIALLNLKDKLKTTASCHPIDLPHENIALNIGFECVATGWGLTSKDNENISDLPQKVSLPIVSREDCSKSYSQQTKVFKTNVCAGGSKGKGICNGDSGGPLNCLFKGNWTYVGLDSFTVPCAVHGYPSVFTRVSEYNTWIRNKIQK